MGQERGWTSQMVTCDVGKSYEDVVKVENVTMKSEG